MKKGFTLIELLGVILILGIIATIITITIDSSIKKSRLNSCLSQEKNIIEAAKTYLYVNPNETPADGSYKAITIANLTNKYLDSNLKNPINDESYTNDKIIVISCNKKSYKYKVCYDNQSSSCNDKEEDTCTYVTSNLTNVCNE